MPEHSEEIASLAAGSPDDAWEMAGGFGFTDEIAVKLDARWRELGGRTRAVPVSLVDLAWLIEGYARARQAVLSGSSEMAEQFEEIEHVAFNPRQLGLDGQSALERVVSDWQRGGWALLRVVPHHPYESVAVFTRRTEDDRG